ncbi:MAG TPA: hypothetical protein VHN98_01405 [Acidimicrobiales bacterium]|nr:hypothetical protein [Acidimicrobiales bacterium]
MPLLAAALTLLAHNGKFTWDEWLYLLIPVAIVVTIVLSARRKQREAQASADMLQGPPETKS